MKQKNLILFFILFSSSIIFANTDSASIGTWTPKAIAGLNISQLSLTNWAKGGDNSFTWTLIGDIGYDYKSSNWNFKNSLKIAYGRTKLGTEDFKTNDNELFIENVLSKNIGWVVDPYFSNTIRTSVTEGFDYKQTPAVKIADFFDPGYIVQSLGFTYDQDKIIQTRLGVAFQEIIANNQSLLYTDNKETAEVEKFKFETGLESVTTLTLNLDQNIQFKSALRLFSRFESLDVWDVRWDNSFVAKVNNYINVNLNVLLVYEKNVTPLTQLKQALQLGIVYTFI